MTGMQIACDPKHNKINFTGNRYLSEILSQQKQFCPLVRPGPKPHIPLGCIFVDTISNEGKVTWGATRNNFEN